MHTNVMVGTAIRRRVGMAIPVIIAIVSLGLWTAPAQASSGDGVCDAEETCLYVDAYFTSWIYDTFYSTADYSSRTFNGCIIPWTCPLNDNVSSLKNLDSTKQAKYYTNAYGSGYGHIVKPLGTRSNLTTVMAPDGGSFNDRFSSSCWLGTNYYWCL